MALFPRGNYSAPRPSEPQPWPVKANWTAGENRTIQYNWTVDARACGRPPPDFDLPIVCIGMGLWRGGTVESPALSYAAYEKCCQRNTSAALEMFTMPNSCSSAWCFTNDEQNVVRTWSSCFKNAVQDQIERVRQQNSSGIIKDMHPDNTITRCEVIDYEMLKKGLVNKPKEAGSAGGESIHRIGAGGWAVMLGGVVVAILSWGI